MTTKKSTSTKARGESSASASAQHDLDRLYVAHQVHTMAHLLLQQIVAGRHWMAAGPTPVAGSFATGPTMPQHGHGMVVPTAAPAPFFYWYP
jgi:hypothetical protein